MNYTRNSGKFESEEKKGPKSSTNFVLSRRVVSQVTSLKGRSKTLQPPAQEGRPFRSGRSSIQNGEEIGIVDRALNAAPLWERIVHVVIGHNAECARRELSEGRVTEAKLLDKERIVAEEVRCLLCTSQRGDWVGRVSDDENWVLKLRRGVRRESLNRANGPTIRIVTK